LTIINIIDYYNEEEQVIKLQEEMQRYPPGVKGYKSCAVGKAEEIGNAATPTENESTSAENGSNDESARVHSFSKGVDLPSAQID
jgi:hypothetical protein